MPSRSNFVIALAVSAAMLLLTAACSPKPAPPSYGSQVKPVIRDIHSALANGVPGRWRPALDKDLSVLAKARPSAPDKAYHRQLQLCVTALIDVSDATASWAPGAAVDRDSAVTMADRWLAARAEIAVLDKWPSGGGRTRIDSRGFYRLVRSMLLRGQQPLNEDFNRFVSEPNFDSSLAMEKLDNIVGGLEADRERVSTVQPPKELKAVQIQLLRGFSHDLEANQLYKEALSSSDADLAKTKAAAAERGWARTDDLLSAALEDLAAAVPGAELLKIR